MVQTTVLRKGRDEEGFLSRKSLGPRDLEIRRAHSLSQSWISWAPRNMSSKHLKVERAIRSAET